ncbi:MAG: HAMP domain-containing histidine kinase [Deltaproteobacteria bacterium]|nr:HAMP domain-containing histidine kinase [Deltaproteobacteria bacterium]
MAILPHAAGRSNAGPKPQALRLRADWVRFLVHDLRGPLTSVLANLDFVRGQLDGSAGHREECDALGDSNYELKRMAAMVQDLLDVDRFDRGHLALERAELDVGPLLDGLLRELRWISGARGIELRYHAEPGLTVWADPPLLGRVLENLCRNALRFSPRDQPIDIDLAGRPDDVIVTVINRGPAIHPANREQIFEPYVRLDQQSSAKGVGLGLAFCRLAVEAHGGRIWVEDPPGGGVAFVFSLPRRPAAR